MGLPQRQTSASLFLIYRLFSLAKYATFASFALFIINMVVEFYIPLSDAFYLRMEAHRCTCFMNLRASRLGDFDCIDFLIFFATKPGAPCYATLFCFNRAWIWRYGGVNSSTWQEGRGARKSEGYAWDAERLGWVGIGVEDMMPGFPHPFAGERRGDFVLVPEPRVTNVTALASL
ncbi:hypothetical protein T440DRAFT_3916 [Plenodomus tracheiphilus IPT5]|uniref:Uncharacterized protein n=1 Tax=Plenodomus tracheiphilus IPT5 TaxID=1408161 RepID=A0A6A7BPX4_9PLEO|nr:hypothetical protein T440DRAFT_3916 [Plenodomus tracheiphilus IPT5]